MNIGTVMLALSVLMLGVSGYLGKMLYSAYVMNTDGSTRKKVIGAVLALTSIGAVGATTAATYQATGPTLYSVPTGGIIVQGDAKFIVSWDPYGLDEAKNVDWGNIELNKKYTRTLYTVNTGPSPLACTFSLQNWNWVTTNPANEVTVNFLFETAPLAPGRFRAIVIEFTVIKPLPSNDPANPLVSNFKYDIVITGTSVIG